MMPSKKKQHLFDKPRNVKLLLHAFYFICALVLVLDCILHRHTVQQWDAIPGFYALFGYIAYVTIVLTAKLLRKMVKRKEDYYDVDG